MAVMTKKELRKLEEYFYYVGYKNWYPFPQELKAVGYLWKGTFSTGME
ncbi:Uncharacterised protein [Mycobacteroides abscessus subsp. abscessus]|nr:Uncharacterised protein [Mycobacteroides abscessus subsp. abscessus]